MTFNWPVVLQQLISLTIKSSSRRALQRNRVLITAHSQASDVPQHRFANEGGRIVASGRRDAGARGWLLNSASWRRSRVSSLRCAPEDESAQLGLTRRSTRLVAWMWPFNTAA